MKIFKNRVVATVIILAMIMSLFASLTVNAAASSITVNWNDEKQVIDGFGVSQAAWSYAIYDLNEPERTEVLDLLFSQEDGVGFSILRGQIFPEYNPAPGVYDFATVRPDQAWVMQEAKARGVDKLVATCWSPPAWMKTNNQTNYGGFLEYNHYTDFAQLLSKFITGYEQEYGLDLYAISMANEPNSMTFLSWNSCEWYDTDIKNFLKNDLKPAMLAEGVDDTKVIAAEPSVWSESMMNEALNDPASAERLDIVAAHNYTFPYPIVPFDNARSKGKQVWMSEISKPGSYDPTMSSGLDWAKDIHEFMTSAEVNAWLYWTGAYPGQNDEGLICTDLQNSTYETTKRLYTIGQYSKFIKPGYERIGATEEPVSGVYVSAYKDEATGDFSIVVINDNDKSKEIEIAPSGFTAGYVVPYTTNATLDIAKGNDIPLENGTFDALLPSNSVTTFVGKKDSLPLAANQVLTDYYDDWTLVDSHSSNLILSGSNASRFEWDSSRVTRSDSNTGSIVYDIPGMKDFTATIYHHEYYDGIQFLASDDGVNWEEIEHASTDGYNVAGIYRWFKKRYKPISRIPDDMKYFKVVISGDGTWHKQLSKIEIEY